MLTVGPHTAVKNAFLPSFNVIITQQGVGAAGA